MFCPVPRRLIKTLKGTFCRAYLQCYHICISIRRSKNYTMRCALQSDSQRGVAVGGEWQVKHTTFTQETRLHTLNHMDLVPKFNLYIVRLDGEPLCATYTEANDSRKQHYMTTWDENTLSTNSIFTH